MFTYKLILSYKGGQYSGWQKQNNARTIQGEFEKSVSQVVKSKEIHSIGCGRTDAGVHALGQVVKLSIPQSIPEDGLLRGVNSHLPRDIEVLMSHAVETDFHPIRDCKSKEYIYLFAAEAPSVFDKEFLFFNKNIDFIQLEKSLNLFLGEKNFFNYMCTGTEVNSTVRTLYSLELLAPGEFKDLLFPTPFFTLRVRGSGFLKQMVRLIVGALLKYNEKKITISDIEESFTRFTDVPVHLAPVAPAHGLFLYQANY